MDLRGQMSKVVTDLLLACKQAAKQENYEAALKSANAALKISDNDNVAPSHMISLFEHRHTIYVRLNDLDSALKDAKSMIRLDRKDARGYIRCGMIERLKDNKSAAVKYFEHGLKSVPSSDPNLDLLTREMKKIRDQISAELVLSRAKDPMTTLPLEIVEFIISYIDYRQHVQLLRVSKSWKKILVSLPPLTDTLAFPRTEKPITPKMLLPALRRLRAPKALRVTNLTQSASGILMDRLQRLQIFKSLQSLEVCDPSIQLRTLLLSQYNLRTVVIDDPTPCPIELVYKMLQECSGLEVARFRRLTGFPNTLALCSKSLLELEVRHPGCAPVFSDFTLDLPRVRRLFLRGFGCASLDVSEISDLRHMEQLESLTFRECIIPNLLLPPSIKHLCMEACTFVDELEEGSWVGHPPPSFPPLDNLETLDMLYSESRSHNPQPYPRFIRQAASKTKSGKLWALRLSQNSEWPAHLISVMESEWFKGLTWLQAEGPELRDEHSQLFLASCPDLETLYISNASITGVFVSDLVKAPTSKLSEITLDGCPKVSRDIVPWAKERGVEVEYISYATKPNGLRVREGH